MQSIKREIILFLLSSAILIGTIAGAYLLYLSDFGRLIVFRQNTYSAINTYPDFIDYYIGKDWRYVRHGMKKGFDNRSRIISKEYYYDDRLHGAKNRWYKNGKIYSHYHFSRDDRIIWIRHYVNGKLDGFEERWYRDDRDGRQNITYYISGKKHGKEMRWMGTSTYEFWYDMDERTTKNKFKDKYPQLYERYFAGNRDDTSADQ